MSAGKGKIEISENFDSEIAKGWRSLWMSLRNWQACDTGRIHTEGSIMHGHRLYSSKEECERNALEWQRDYPGWAEYLGSFQEEI